MRNLLLDEGHMIRVESTSLPVATYSKFQPQSVDFLDITNPKAVLENALRNFACLTAGDVIAIDYNNKVYEVCVLETKPGHAVSIIECDINLEFAAPVGYQEPERPDVPESISSFASSMDGEILEESLEPRFPGGGFRLDGKTSSAPSPTQMGVRKPPRRGIPDYGYRIGTIRFIRTLKPMIPSFDGPSTSKGSEPGDSWGKGQHLLKRFEKK